jgi:NitT/TauT family transport system ATP-binding protein
VKEMAIPLAYPRSQKVRFTPAFTAAERIASEALGVVAPTADEASAHAAQGAGRQ